MATTHRILTHSTLTQKRYGYTGDGEVADLEVVLKKNGLLLLTVPRHCRPTRTSAGADPPEYFRQMDKQLKRFDTQLHE